MRSAWIRRAGPGAVAVLAVGLLTSTTLGARGHPWAPSICPTAGPVGDPTAHGVSVQASRPSADAAWFRLDPILDATGALAGQRLAVGGRDGRDQRILDLDPESFATGPFGTVVLVGTDDGSGSRLLVLDPGAGCVSVADTSTDIIRRATIAPDGRSVVESRLDRRTRADLGIWRRPLGRDGEATRIAPAIGPDARFGRTWSTDLSWSMDGADLAIQSCAEVACRTRILTLATGRLRLIDDADLGPAIGLADGRLVSYLACRGWPCPVVAVTIADGRRRVLAPDAGAAVVALTEDGPRLVHEHGPRNDRRVASVTLDGTETDDLGTLPGGLGLAVRGRWSDGATSAPRDWILLAPDGRAQFDGAGHVPILRHVLDGHTGPIDEVLR